MPRTPLEPRFTIDYLSILDSDGHLDTALEPELSDDELKRMYRAMLLGRRLDERMVRLQRQGRIGTFAPIKGQEAAQIGSIVTLAKTDWMVPSFRETAAMLWRGWPIEKLLLFFSGRLEGGQPAPDQRDLPITIPVATQLPHAVGLAYAVQYRGDRAVVMAFFGGALLDRYGGRSVMVAADLCRAGVIVLVPFAAQQSVAYIYLLGAVLGALTYTLVRGDQP